LEANGLGFFVVRFPVFRFIFSPVGLKDITATGARELIFLISGVFYFNVRKKLFSLNFIYTP